MPVSAGVLSCASLTVLVPHYAETILLSSGEVAASTEEDGATPMPFLVQRFADEYNNFVERYYTAIEPETYSPCCYRLLRSRAFDPHIGRRTRRRSPRRRAAVVSRSDTHRYRS